MRRTLLTCGLAVATTLAVITGCGKDERAATSTESTQTVPFDRAFIDGMVPHHERAIKMAGDAKDAGLTEPVLVDIANSIIGSQQSEIDRMVQWRGDWFGSSEIDPDGGEALGLSMEQMGMRDERMDFSSENDVDAAFARMMIAHHEGAIAMAQLARTQAQHKEIQALATAVIATQREEIGVMRKFVGAGEHDMSDMGGG